MKTYSIAFIFAVICFVAGATAIFFAWSVLFNFNPDIPGGGPLMMPDPYNREAAETSLAILLDGNYARTLPTIGTGFGLAVILLGLVCLWLGFALHVYEKRIEALEKK